MTKLSRIRHKKYYLYNIQKQLCEEKNKTLIKEDVKKLVLKM